MGRCWLWLAALWLCPEQAGIRLLVSFIHGMGGNEVTVKAGSKTEWGRGGFEVYAMPPGAAHTITVEETQYAVQAGDELTIVTWKPV